MGCMEFFRAGVSFLSLYLYVALLLTSFLAHIFHFFSRLPLLIVHIKSEMVNCINAISGLRNVLVLHLVSDTDLGFYKIRT